MLINYVLCTLVVYEQSLLLELTCIIIDVTILLKYLKTFLHNFSLKYAIKSVLIALRFSYGVIP